MVCLDCIVAKIGDLFHVGAMNGLLLFVIPLSLSSFVNRGTLFFRRSFPNLIDCLKTDAGITA